MAGKQPIPPSIGEDATLFCNHSTSSGTRHIAQVTATMITKILKVSQFSPSIDIVQWWTDMVALINTVISASTLDPYVAFGAIPLLERYVHEYDQPACSLDAHRSFLGSLIVASKIICPRQTVPWSCILKEKFMDESVAWMEREFLITVSWDRWMMEIVEEVWNAYDQALAERLGDACRARSFIGRDRRPVLSWGSSVTSAGHDSSAYTSESILHPPFLLNSPVERGLPRTRSSLWEEFMSDRPRPGSSDVDMDKYLDVINSARHVPAQKPNNSRILRTKWSTMFNSR